MERFESLKLYFIGGLSLLALVIGALVFLTVISVENSISTGLQFFGVGMLLAVLFALFGGFSDVAAQGRAVKGFIDAELEGLPTPPPALTQRLAEGLEPVLPNPEETGVPDLVVAIADEDRPSIGSGAELDVSLALMAVLPSNDESERQFLDRYESSLIDALIDAGELSDDGPLTDHDVGVILIAAVARTELDQQLALARGSG